MNAHLFESLSFIWNFKLDEREKMDNDWNWIFPFINNSKYIWVILYKIRNDTMTYFEIFQKKCSNQPISDHRN